MTDMMLTPQQWADAHGVVIRTVRRYLDAGRLVGAVQGDDGRWMIPATATPTDAGPSTTIATARPGGAPAASSRPAAAPSLAAMLDGQPAYLDLETAGRLLGVSTGTIRRHRDRFGAEPFGPNGSLVVPASTVRHVAGIGA